jgi:hypothetical protein
LPIEVKLVCQDSYFANFIQPSFGQIGENINGSNRSELGEFGAGTRTGGADHGELRTSLGREGGEGKALWKHWKNMENMKTPENTISLEELFFFLWTFFGCSHFVGFPFWDFLELGDHPGWERPGLLLFVYIQYTYMITIHHYTCIPNNIA